MKRIISLSFAISLVFMLTGCDWLRSTLGMPTSDELERYKQFTQVVSDSVPAPKVSDSTTISSDSVGGNQAVITDKPETQAPAQAQAQAHAQAQVQTQPSTTTVASSTSQEMRFYVIAGSFSDAANAEKMATYLKESGYSPIRLTFKNGYNVVASSAHKQISEAYASLRKLLELDFSPEDIWIYDSEKQKLHIQTK